MKKSGNLFIIIGLVMMITAVGLQWYNGYTNKAAGEFANSTYDELQATMLRVEEEETEKEKVVTLNGNGYIGTISIPSLGLTLPIMDSWSNNKMKVSPCRYYGTIETNDLVLCSHSYDNLLGDIGKLKQGDKVLITDMNDNKYVYEVKVVEILNPTDVKEMVESEFDLTLFTCTKDNLNRMTVRLNKVNV